MTPLLIAFIVLILLLLLINLLPLDARAKNILYIVLVVFAILYLIGGAGLLRR